MLPLFIFCFFVIAKAQNVYMRYAHEGDEELFPVSGVEDDEGNRLVLLNGFSSDYSVWKVDSNNSLIWGRKYGISGWPEHLSNLAFTDDGGFVVVGQRWAQDGPCTSGGWHTAIDKFTSKDVYEWGWRYKVDDSGGAGVSDTVLVMDDSILQSADSEGSLVSYVTCFDRSGNVMWIRKMGRIEKTRRLLATKGGGYISCGETRYFGNSRAYLFKFDTYHNFTWGKIIENVGHDFFCSRVGIVETEKGEIVFSSGSNGQILVVSLSSNGEILWKRSYAKTGGGGPLIYTRDGGFLMSGWTTEYSANKKGLLMKLDRIGRLEWASVFGGSGDDLPYILFSDNDGGYSVYSFTKSWNFNPEKWATTIFKFSHDGEGCAFSQLVTEDYASTTPNISVIDVPLAEEGDWIEYLTSPDHMDVPSMNIFQVYTPSFTTLCNSEVYLYWLKAPERQVVHKCCSFKYQVVGTSNQSNCSLMYSIDDETNFKIDENGFISNIVDLDFGTYDLKVTIFAGAHNLSSWFSIVVVDIVEPVCSNWAGSNCSICLLSSNFDQTFCDHTCANNRYGDDCSCDTNCSSVSGNSICTEGECRCNIGWYGDDCSCNKNNCSSLIHSTGECLGGFCVCHQNWKGESCSECNDWYFGDDCLYSDTTLVVVQSTVVRNSVEHDDTSASVVKSGDLIVVYGDGNTLQSVRLTRLCGQISTKLLEERNCFSQVSQPTQVNSVVPTSAIMLPDTVGLRNGGYAVSWIHAELPNYSPPKTQAFKENGDKDGSEYDCYDPGPPWNPAHRVTPRSENSYIVAWTGWKKHYWWAGFFESFTGSLGSSGWKYVENAPFYHINFGKNNALLTSSDVFVSEFNGAGYASYFRCYNSNDDIIYQSNSFGEIQNMDPRPCMGLVMTELVEGRFVVVWNKNVGSKSEIWGQFYNTSSCHPLSDSFRISEVSEKEAGCPVVTRVNENGDFIVVWRKYILGYGSIENYEGRVFNLHGFSIGEEFQVLPDRIFFNKAGWGGGLFLEPISGIVSPDQAFLVVWKNSSLSTVVQVMVVKSCNNTCINGECESPSFCKCFDGFYGSDCSCNENCSSLNPWRQCISGECRCVPGSDMYGVDCSCNVDCSSVYNHSIGCSNGICVCDDQWFGEDCSCSENCDLMNNRTCVDGNCICLKGLFGNDCLCYDNCYLMNNRTCVDGGCVCLNGYGGDECEYSYCFDVLSNESSVCSGAGNCTEYQNCECEFGYGGENCEFFECDGILSNEIDSCTPVWGTCTGPDSCTCDEGYLPSYYCSKWKCDEYFMDEPQERYCRGRGNCSKPDICQCELVYNGDNCEHIRCGSYFSNETEVCNNRGTCVGVHNCSCTVSADFTGINCEHPICFNQNLLDDLPVDVCSGKGDCVGPNKCDCSDKIQHGGLECELFYCYSVLSNETSVCSGSGNCTAFNQCECEFGYGGEGCQFYDCNGILSNETISCTPDHGTCTGPDSCSCDAGYLVNEYCGKWLCDGFLNDDPLERYCNQRGNCTHPNWCSCEKNYTGENCQLIKCGAYWSNETEVCTSRGLCFSINDCTCNEPSKYTGLDCEYPICFTKNSYDNLPSEICSGRGLCNKPNYCDCSDPIKIGGEECELSYCFTILSNLTTVCSGVGNCTDFNHCECEFGYGGEDCQFYECNGILSNETDVCTPTYGTCTGPDTCTCNPGYLVVEYCSKWMCGGFVNDDTLKQFCSNKGNCTFPNWCECENDYGGENCQFLKCGGYLNNETEVCNSRGNCLTINNCTCNVPSDYTGLDCEYPICFNRNLFDDIPADICTGKGSCLAPNKCDCTDKIQNGGEECELFYCDNILSNETSVCNGVGKCCSYQKCECDEGKYGDFCQFDCSSNCNNSCDQETGSICDSCIDGKFDIFNRCDTNCPNNCIGGCDEFYGSCSDGCINGTYGEQCGKNCSGCIVCDQETGLICEEGCIKGYWGINNGCSKNCSQKCDPYRDCDSITGECLNECIAQYWGPLCDNICENCTFCDKMTGELCEGCIKGKWGITGGCSNDCLFSGCAEPYTCSPYSGFCENCPNGKWGLRTGCEHDCPPNCNSSECDENGICLSCSEGFKGVFCSEFRCFGIDSNDSGVCSSKGNCTQPDTCSCTSSFEGESCSHWRCNTFLNDDSRACSDRGFCSSSGRCVCHLGIEGERCDQWKCFGVGNLGKEVCSSRGSCESPNVCSCSSRYIGNICHCDSVEDCLTKTVDDEGGNGVEIVFFEKVDGASFNYISENASEICFDNFESNRTLKTKTFGTGTTSIKFKLRFKNPKFFSIQEVEVRMVEFIPTPDETVIVVLGKYHQGVMGNKSINVFLEKVSLYDHYIEVVQETEGMNDTIPFFVNKIRVKHSPRIKKKALNSFMELPLSSRVGVVLASVGVVVVLCLICIFVIVAIFVFQLVVKAKKKKVVGSHSEHSNDQEMITDDLDSGNIEEEEKVDGYVATEKSSLDEEKDDYVVERKSDCHQRKEIEEVSDCPSVDSSNLMDEVDRDEKIDIGQSNQGFHLPRRGVLPKIQQQPQVVNMHYYITQPSGAVLTLPNNQTFQFGSQQPVNQFVVLANHPEPKINSPKSETVNKPSLLSRNDLERVYKMAQKDQESLEKVMKLEEKDYELKMEKKKVERLMLELKNLRKQE